MLSGCALMLLLPSLPYFQKSLTAHLSDALSRKTGAEVSIGKIEIGLFNRVILHDVAVKDKKGADIISAERLSAKIKVSSLVRPPLTIRTIELYGAEINVYKDREGQPCNFSFIADSLFSEKGGGSPPDLRIKSVILGRAAFNYDVKDAAAKKGFDINHIRVRDLYASTSLRIRKSSVYEIRVRNLAFREKCGISLRRAFMTSAIGKRKCNVPVLEFETDNSKAAVKDLSIPLSDAEAEDGGWGAADIDLGLQDVNAFFPALKLPGRKYRISARMNIAGGAVCSPAVRITNGKSENLNAAVRYKSPKQFSARINSLYLSEDEAALIARIAAKDTAFSKFARNAGYVRFKGEAKCGTDGLDVRGTLGTRAGDLTCSATVSGGFSVKAESGSLHLGRLLSMPGTLGKASLSIECKGAGKKDFAAAAHVRHIEINEYSCRNAEITLASRENRLQCSLKTGDPNLESQLSASLYNENGRKRITLDGGIKRINPETLKLTSKYKDTSVSFNASMRMSASSADDAEGSLSFDDICFQTPDSAFRIKRIGLETAPLAGGRKISLDGDFGTAEIAGRLNVRTLAADIMSIIGSENSGVPEPGRASAKRKARREAGKANDFNFHASIPNAAPVNTLLGGAVRIGGKGCFINGYIDSYNSKLLLEGTVPALQWNGQEFSGLSVYCKGDGSALRSNIHFAKTLKEGKANVEIAARKEKDGINCTLLWKNDGGKEHSGNIAQTITFPNNDASVIDFNISPSYVVIEDTAWNISPALLSYSGGKLRISGFNMRHAQKHLNLNGVISKSETDSLTLDLSGVRIRDIMDFVAVDDVEFDGMATGRVNLAGLLATPAVSASLKVEDFKFNNAPMGGMNLTGTWNNDLKQIDLVAGIRDSGGSIGIKGFINTEQSTIDLHFDADKTNALFLNKFLPDAVRMKQGRTSGALRLYGRLNAMNLEGSQKLTGAAIEVVPLGTAYSFSGNTVDFRADTIDFKDFALADRLGNRASLNGYVAHDALHNFRYDFGISTRGFLAYDRQREAGVSFWGTALTTGGIRVHGLPGAFYTEADVRPESGTVFTYNADMPDNPENAQLLTYRSADKDAAKADGAASAGRAAEAESGSAADIRLDFTINVTPDAEVRVIMNEETDNTIAVRGDGTVHAQFYNKGNFEMFGVYNILSGTYKMTLQDFIRKDFRFRSGGTVTFNGNPFAGDINLQAVYTVPSASLSDLMADGNLRDNSVKVDCIMNFTGSVEQPAVSFDLDMPALSYDERQMVRSLIATPEDMNMQVVYLLSFGRFYTYNYASQGMTPSQSQSSLAMNSFLSSTLSSNLNSFLSNFMEEGKWTFGTNLATGSDGWNNMDVEGAFTGRLFNNRLILNGNLGYRDRNAYNSNFVGDFSVVYLLNPRGTIQLKAYSESNDRYFTKSTLTTQGGGVVFKRDFTRLRDLFRRSKPKTEK